MRWTNEDGSVHERQCASGAMWVIPEAAYCTHHMPFEWLSVSRSRTQRWKSEAAWLWNVIIEEEPLPDGI
jgi:hypothetical protein